MSQKDEEEAVRRAPIFTAIDEASAASLRASMTAIKVTKGQVIFKEGDAGDRLFVVITGASRIGVSFPILSQWPRALVMVHQSAR